MTCSAVTWVGDPQESLFDPWALPLVGRDAVLATCREVVSSRVGCLMVARERLVGTTRVAVELMRWIEASGIRVVSAEGGGDDPEVRLRRTLSRAGVRNAEGDPSARFAVFLSDCDEDAQLGLWAREFRETVGLVVCTGVGSRVAPTVRIAPLRDDDIEAVERTVAPGIDAAREPRWSTFATVCLDARSFSRRLSKRIGSRCRNAWPCRARAWRSSR